MFLLDYKRIKFFDDAFIATISTTIIAFISTLLSVYNFFTVFSNQRFNNSFGVFMKFRLLGIFIQSLVVLFYVSPITAFAETFNLGYFHKFMGQLMAFGFNFSLFISLSTSANRFMAIAFPILYMKIFNSQVVRKIVVVSMLMALSISCVQFIDKCGMFYDAKTFIWFYEDSPCAAFINFWLDYLTGLLTVFLCLLVDFFTLLFLVKRKYFDRKLKNITKSTNAQEHVIKLTDVLFYVQSGLHNILTALSLVSFHYLSSFANSDLELFVTVGLIFALAPLIDNTLIFLFNINPAIKTIKVQKIIVTKTSKNYS
uniref:G_PROTEIN_RECEP_F1_2 domain-containing protein n=1 Tax=Rhabditophanes sp. KR3021 TaxID=114890 RepID=A0AC35U1Z7_9BILA